MSNYNEKIVNVLTGETIIRDYTAKEIAEVEAVIAKVEAERLAKEQAETDRIAARQAIFDRLGITADEAAVLGL